VARKRSANRAVLGLQILPIALRPDRGRTRERDTLKGEKCCPVKSLHPDLMRARLHPRIKSEDMLFGSMPAVERLAS
jgi:hypothetical protein